MSVPQLRLAQIARALVQSGDILVLDEPTAVLSEPDAEHLLERLISFREAGKAIIYITHRLSEVMRIADRVTVLRDGKRVGHFARGAFDRAQLVALMVKAEQNFGSNSVFDEKRSALTQRPKTVPDGGPALAVRELRPGAGSSMSVSQQMPARSWGSLAFKDPAMVMCCAPSRASIDAMRAMSGYSAFR